MKNLKLKIKLLTTTIELNKIKQKNKELINQINIMILNAKEREANIKDLIAFRDMYKNGYGKDHRELIKLKNDYKLLSHEYEKQIIKIEKLEKKVGKNENRQKNVK